ncbi:(d)CMP kinase [Kaistella sp. PBT33-4]|uniref:(d)CMP kinase n=1 Tax=Kaistella sp. PBT33-4 TaxID=3032000 RepID=UPI0023D87FBB|nr:(d)CMP kinase [Kaistella sp. PBT33-4]MDF0719831.1 (d)CMP kinase [Kaistella sp. PBT33-4]
MRKPVIAIDGFSSTGKSSISKAIAARLGLIHMDTGALYRAVTYYALHHCFYNEEIDFGCLISELPSINLEFRNISGTLVLFLNGQDITAEIREPEISGFVSLVAKQAEVRNYLLDLQRKGAAAGGIIMDGRDIGTVVLPDADYKFFLTASVDERTNRRHLELTNQGVTIDKMAVRENLVTRDRIDSERETAPLKKAADAILIDNTDLNKEETISLITSYIKEF